MEELIRGAPPYR